MRKRWKTIVVAACCLIFWSWAAWGVYTSIDWADRARESSPQEVARRKAGAEWLAARKREKEQIESLVNLAARHLTALGGKCREAPKKGDGILDEVDLSQWHGSNADLALLKVFLLLEDDNRDNQHNNWFSLTLGPWATEASLRYLEDLTNLQSLKLRGAAVTGAGLRHLQKLTRLHALDLSSTQIADGGLHHLRGLTQLRDLSLADTLITNEAFHDLEGLAKLRQVDVSGTQVTVPGIVQFCRARPTVEVTCTGGYTQGSLHELRFLRPAATDDLLRQFTALESYHCIWLHDTSITGAGLVALAGQDHLSNLSIERTPITDEGLKHLHGLPKLSSLRLAEVRITDAGLRDLTRNSLPSLTSLDLGETSITDAGLVYLKSFEKLQRLSLYRTNVSDAGIGHLETLSHLREVNFNKSNVSWARMEQFRRQNPKVTVWADENPCVSFTICCAGRRAALCFSAVFA